MKNLTFMLAILQNEKLHYIVSIDNTMHSYDTITLDNTNNVKIKTFTKQQALCYMNDFIEANIDIALIPINTQSIFYKTYCK